MTSQPQSDQGRPLTRREILQREREEQATQEAAQAAAEAEAVEKAAEAEAAAEKAAAEKAAQEAKVAQEAKAAEKAAESEAQRLSAEAKNVAENKQATLAQRMAQARAQNQASGQISLQDAFRPGGQLPPREGFEVPTLAPEGGERRPVKADFKPKPSVSQTAFTPEPVSSAFAPQPVNEDKRVAPVAPTASLASTESLDSKKSGVVEVQVPDWSAVVKPPQQTKAVRTVEETGELSRFKEPEGTEPGKTKAISRNELNALTSDDVAKLQVAANNKKDEPVSRKELKNTKETNENSSYGVLQYAILIVVSVILGLLIWNLGLKGRNEPESSSATQSTSVQVQKLDFNQTT